MLARILSHLIPDPSPPPPHPSHLEFFNNPEQGLETVVSAHTCAGHIAAIGVISGGAFAFPVTERHQLSSTHMCSLPLLSNIHRLLRNPAPRTFFGVQDCLKTLSAKHIFMTFQDPLSVVLIPEIPLSRVLNCGVWGRVASRALGRGLSPVTEPF